MPIDLTFNYHPALRAQFADGSLVEKWRNAYADMFDADDYRLAKRQSDYHFFEWLAAVLFRESTGYYSLLEKYETHPEKIKIFSEKVDPETFKFVMSHRAGIPDLFLYRPDKDEWFFCEVKGGPDRVSARQRDIQECLEKVSGREIRILRLRRI